MAVDLVTDEQKEKRPSQFIKLEDKDKLTILSNLVKIKTHYLQSKKMSVIHKEQNCAFDTEKTQPRTEYFYYALVNEEEGIVRVPASVFFDLNKQERVLEIDKRDSVWVISKSGSGKETEYGVARGKEAGTPPIAVEKANEKLVKAIESYSNFLQKKYDEIEADSSLAGEQPPQEEQEEEE